MTTSTALDQFITIFQTVIVRFATIIIPLLVITWAVRITSDLLRGTK